MEFRASRARAIRLVLGSLAFAAAGIWTAMSGSWVGWAGAVGWAASAFGRLCLVVAIIQLVVAGRTVLKLDPDGFAMIQWGLGRRRSKEFLSWNDAESFWVTRLIWGKVIAIKCSPSFRTSRGTRVLMRSLTLAPGVGGFDGIIPDQYSERPETICATLNEWKRRYG